MLEEVVVPPGVVSGGLVGEFLEELLLGGLCDPLVLLLCGLAELRFLVEFLLVLPDKGDCKVLVVVVLALELDVGHHHIVIGFLFVLGAEPEFGFGWGYGHFNLLIRRRKIKFFKSRILKKVKKLEIKKGKLL